MLLAAGSGCLLWLLERAAGIQIIRCGMELCGYVCHCSLFEFLFQFCREWVGAAVVVLVAGSFEQRFGFWHCVVFVAY